MRTRRQANPAPSMPGVLLIWVDPTMHWHGQANGKPGRSPTFSDAAMQFCLAIKGLLDLSLRQAVHLTKKLFQASGLNWPVPNYSTISRRRTLLREVVVDIHDPAGWHLLVDDHGIQILSIGDWEIRNRNSDWQCQWVKLQLSIKYQ